MKYIFIIDDPVYGGHIKSFLAQFKSLNLKKDYLLFLPTYSYIFRNIDTFSFIDKQNVVLYNPNGLLKYFFSFDLFDKLKQNLNEEKTIIHSFSQRSFF